MWCQEKYLALYLKSQSKASKKTINNKQVNHKNKLIKLYKTDDTNDE